MDSNIGACMKIRDETVADAAQISALTTAAFLPMEYADGTEAQIIEGLRAAGALGVSLVAEMDSDVVGHVAFSAVTVDGEDCGWFVLGPVSVRTDLQRQGIGSSMIRAGLDRLRERGAAGCTVLGDPDYYRRFGFEPSEKLLMDGEFNPNFQVLSFGAPEPRAALRFHDAFYIS